MDRDGGQSTLLMVAAVGLVAMMLLALGPMGRAVVDRARARTAADAAALAGAAEGEEVARSVAAANGAALSSFRPDGDEVVVEVEIAGQSAFSRARRIRVAPSRAGGEGVPAGDPGGLVPAMREALRRAGALLGGPVPITSGYRSPERQRELWERRHSNPFPVARPGTSMHERGLAVDVPRRVVGRLVEVAGAAGLCQPLPESDPIHFELCGSR